MPQSYDAQEVEKIASFYDNFTKDGIFSLTHPTCTGISSALWGDFGLRRGGRGEGGKLLHNVG